MAKKNQIGMKGFVRQVNSAPSSSDEMPTQKLILAMEASGDSVSVALMQKQICKVFKEHKARFGHAEHLVGMVRNALDEVGVDFSDISHIAAGCGPGSFTGLRVCLAAAKGYVLASQAQPIGVNGLAALALDMVSDQKLAMNVMSPVICFADTRRQSVFAQIFNSKACALSSVVDIPFDQMDSWITQIQEQHENRPLVLSGVSEQMSAHGFSAENILMSATTPVDAAMIGRYADRSLTMPNDYPHCGFIPLYVVPPKLGPKKRQV